MVTDTSTKITVLQELYRRRTTWHRSEKSLTLQGKATCRRICDGDKDQADKLYAVLAKLPSDDLDAIIAGNPLNYGPDITVGVLDVHPLLTARGVIEHYRDQVENEMVALVKTLPICTWIEAIDGVSYMSLAAVVGSTGDLWNYPTVQGLWKRMGLAVMPNGRQRHMRDAELAKEHGYSAVRRSIVWNIGTSILRSQTERQEKAEDETGKKVKTGVIKKPSGPWRAIYDARKAYEQAKNEAGDYAEQAEQRLRDYKYGPTTAAYKAYKAGKLPDLHIHMRAQRYMEKRFLRELWREWRRVMPKPMFVEPARADQDAA